MGKESNRFETYVNGAIVIISFIEVIYSLSAKVKPDTPIFLNPFTIIIIVTMGISIWLILNRVYTPLAVVIGSALLSMYLISQPPRVEIIVFYNELDDNERFSSTNTYIIENTLKKEPIRIIDSNGQTYNLTINNDGKASVTLKNVGPTKVVVCETSAFYEIDRHSTIIICSLNKSDLKNCVNSANVNIAIKM